MKKEIIVGVIGLVGLAGGFLIYENLEKNSELEIMENRCVEKGGVWKNDLVVCKFPEVDLGNLDKDLLDLLENQK